MRLSEMPTAEFRESLARGLTVSTGPFLLEVTSTLSGFAETFQSCYGSLESLAPEHLPHFRVEVTRQRGLRGLVAPQAVFYFEGIQPFDPYPLDQAFPLFEWGLNWCIATTAHQYLMLHSAVVEKHGAAVVLPALPGSGKSTLCAALVNRGWRLLSDEFGLLRHADGTLAPLPRAAPLKNESIQVMRDFAPDARFGPRFDRTRKGTVMHMFPPENSLSRQQEPAAPALIIFPRYDRSVSMDVTAQEPSEAFIRLVNNSFNYQISGESGFLSLLSLVENAPALELRYNDLDRAIDYLETRVSGYASYTRDAENATCP